MRLLRLAAAAVALSLVGCADATAPRKTAVYTPGTQQPPQQARPVWMGCGASEERLFQEAVPIYQATYAYHSGILVSEYTLCGNGTFKLGFVSGGSGDGDYLGTYAQTDSGVTFKFSDSDLVGMWMAAGTFRGDTMSVAYNDAMLVTDFIDGPYLLQPAATTP